MAYLGIVGQIQGPFAAGENLYSKIVNGRAIDGTVNIGIQSDVMVPGTDLETTIILNGEEVVLGRSGIYEVQDLYLESIAFKYDAPPDTLIDFSF